MGLRVKENGKSEGRPVMGRIGIDVARQHHPARKRADFRLVFPHEKTWQTDKEAKQMTAEHVCWCSFPR